MNEEKYHLPASDKKSLHVYEWLPSKGKIKGIIQIIHGMAEHAGRYREFAEELTNCGYFVIAGDLRGHGKTEKTMEDLGFFAGTNGWEIVLEDLFLINAGARKKFPGLPVFLLGHSMGSFFARDYAHTYGDRIAGVLLSGTGGDPGIMGEVGIFLAKREIKKNGKRHRSRLLDNLLFGNFNKRFKNTITKFDWLSRDKEKVNAYVADPLCGYVPTSIFFLDLFGGVKKINKKINISKMPEDLPMLFLSGRKDPVGNNGRGVVQICKKYKKNKNISLKLYKEGRHEMLNEINRKAVYCDVVNWLDNLAVKK